MKNFKLCRVGTAHHIRVLVGSAIKEIIRLAKELGKRAEFWFKQESSPDVRQYIEDKQGIVVVWIKETE